MWHRDGDLVLARGHVVLGVGAGPAPRPGHPGGHCGGERRAGGRVVGALSPEAVQLSWIGVPVTSVGALVPANQRSVKLNKIKLINRCDIDC